MWLFLLACGVPDAPPTPSPEPPPAETSSAAPEGPAGRIGGEPILERPVVVGGITNEAVEAVIEQSQDSLRAC